MKNKPTALDPIRTFYMANELLDPRKIPEELTQSRIIQELEKIKKQANKLTARALLRYHLDNWHPRYDNYVNSTWELKEISLEDCGVWPRMGGLPDEFTVGNVVETAKLVQEYLDDKNKLTWQTSKVLYIDEMKEFAETITEYIPIIVMEDGVIRNSKFEDEKMKPHNKCTYDIDDGNHRAIALALLGKKTTKAWVGKRIYKSNLLYY